MKTPVLESTFNKLQDLGFATLLKKYSNTGVGEITASKFREQHAAQFKFCRYEGLCPAAKAEIHRRSFQWNFAKL